MPRKSYKPKTIAKMSRAKMSDVQYLAKAVKKLQVKEKVQHQYLNYAQSEANVSVIADIVALNLCNYAVGAPIFGADADDDNNYKIIHQDFKVDCYLSLENTVNEPDTITFTMFLVSLTDDIGAAFNNTTGSLTLTANEHYYNLNGHVILNKKCFKTHRKIKKTLTNHGTALTAPSAQTQGGTDYRFMITASPRQVISNVRGDWKTLTNSIDPSKQWYFLIFSDNGSGDLQNPSFTYSLVRTMKTIV